MGMFDSLHDEHGNEWQTKAFDCQLTVYRIGDSIGLPGATFQVHVLGGELHECNDSLATVRDGVLVAVNAARDESLVLVGYSGHVMRHADDQARYLADEKIEATS